MNTTPATLLSEILVESCKHFKVEGSYRSYRLTNKANKDVDLSLPFRLSNLAQGAHLNLVGPNADSDNGMVAQAGAARSVNLRISVSMLGSDSFTITKRADSSMALEDLLENIAHEKNLPKLEAANCSVQIMMKVVGPNDFLLPLAKLGLIEGNHAIRIQVKNKGKRAEDAPKKPAPSLDSSKSAESTGEVAKEKCPKAAETTKVKEMELDQEIAHQREKGQVNTSGPVENTERGEYSTKIVLLAKYDDDDDDDDDNTENSASHGEFGYNITDYDMNLEQAKFYQKILAQRASDQPMLTRSLREQLANEKKKQKMEMKNKLFRGMCEMKIKFPDNKLVQINIDSRKTLKDLREILETDILREEITTRNSGNIKEACYELSIAYPLDIILGGEENKYCAANTIEECEFGNRVSLLFKIKPQYKTLIDTSKGYVKDKIANSESKRQSTCKTSIDEKTKNNNVEVSNNNIAGTDGVIKKSLKLKKLPAWVKLSKT